MKVLHIFVFYLLLTNLLCGSSKVTKLVVLMMENRSFDHLLGWLAQNNTKINGLNGTECNYEVVNDPTSKKFCVNKNGPDQSIDDPAHDFTSTGEQIFGYNINPDKDGDPKMNGFIWNALRVGGNPNVPMSMFTGEMESAPIINLLAGEFAVFDKWHASVPGPTDPNRAYVMSGTSHGATSNFGGTLWEQQSYFDFLSQHNVSWNAFYDHDTWAIMYFKDMYQHHNLKHVHSIDTFFSNVENGKLATYTFLQPRMTTSKEGPPNWQHPDSSVREGERLIKRVYETLRNSDLWDEVALVLTYDEHGGFYDHVVPPQDGIPNPDGVLSSDGFRFDRLGIRVPTIVMSPYVPKGLIVGKPPGPQSNSEYDHTSIIATWNKMLGINDHVTDRVAWAGTFDDIFSLKKPRHDCPKHLPDLPMWTQNDIVTQGNLPLNEHLKIEVDFYCLQNNHDMETCGKNIKNQRQASLFLEKERKIFFQKLGREDLAK